MRASARREQGPGRPSGGRRIVVAMVIVTALAGLWFGLDAQAPGEGEGGGEAGAPAPVRAVPVTVSAPDAGAAAGSAAAGSGTDAGVQVAAPSAADAEGQHNPVPRVPAGSIRGRAVDQYGSGIPAVTVWAGVKGHPRIGALSDLRGSFEIPDLAPGIYRLGAQRLGHQPGEVRGLEVKPEGVTNAGDLLMVATPGFGGHVREASGISSGGATVWWRLSPEPTDGSATVKHVRTDHSGRFWMPAPVGLAGWAWATHPAQGPSKEVFVRAGPDRRIELWLSTPSAIEGRVVDAVTSRPLEGARVSITTLAGGPGQPARSTATLGDGRFRLEGVPPGPRTLVVQAPGHDRLLSTGHEVPWEQSLDAGDIRLWPTAAGSAGGTTYSGIGATLQRKGGRIIVSSTLKGGPAGKARIRSGSEILAIDGVDISELGFADAIERLRGPDGTEVQLTVIPRGRRSSREILLIRRSMALQRRK